MRRPGFTIIELAIILVLIGILCATAVPMFGRARAALAVRAARSELIAALAAARAHAVLTGGAQLLVTPSGELSVQRSDGLPLAGSIDLAARYDVSIETPRGQPIVLRYDGLGIGRMTSATLRIRRAGIDVDVTVSAYGRARS